MNKKAIILLSGGLDSILAAKLALEQGVEVLAINFLTIFCTCTHKGCQHAATKAAQELKIPLKVMNITEEYLQVIKNPKHGYGSNMNPCIDCRIFIFKKAKEYMKDVGASFLVTGEVLGERPMSQRRNAILLIEKEAGLKGLILRPLSAKLFDPTIPEREGIVERDKLLDIRGRCRKPQMALAKEFGINDYPCPAGGCLLTDPGFANRIKDLIEHKALNMDNVKLLKYGRHFRFSNNTKLIVGRDEKENEILKSIAKNDDILFELTDRESPTSILRGGASEDLIRLGAGITAYHTKFRGEKSISVDYGKSGSAEKETIIIKPADKKEVDGLRI
ncbi:MAG: 7-cyano-7-deazaguanine synthase [Candidatus Omnitrophota bacterium]|nr:7-cyano-7-deazaguanine synthase [Candidatus Omnitrophota bacterium]